MLAKYVLVALLPFYIAAVNAANDWSKPCTSGVCEWDTKEKDTSGNMIVTAATSSLSDITPAAGWHILDCDPNSLDPQTIRLVCESEDAKEAGCDAIYEDGAENTIIRLPNSCAQGPFARLARIWDSDDQTIPDEARQKFRKRTVAAPGTVKNAIIDFDFAAVPPKNNVEILVTGSNDPTAPVHQQAAQIRRAYSSQKMRRGLKERAPGDVVDTFLNKLGELTTGGVETAGSSPLVFKKNFPIAKNSQSCPATATTPALTGNFDMNVDVDIDGFARYGFVVEGKLVPPTIGDVGFFTTVTGSASVVFHVVASAQATLDSGRINVGNLPLAALTFPGVATIGPVMEVAVSGKATLGITGKMDVGAKFNLARVELRFPRKEGTSQNNVVSVRAPLSLEVSPQVNLGGTLEGHLIPRVTLGVDLLNGLAKAKVFVDLDMSGTAILGIKADATRGLKQAPPTASKTGFEPTASGSFSGCVEVGSEIAVNAGIEGSIPGILDKSTAIPIFNKPFELFKKCFGQPVAPPGFNPGKAKPVAGTSNSTAAGSPGTNSGLKDAAKLSAKLRPTTAAIAAPSNPATAKAPAKPASPPPPSRQPTRQPTKKPTARSLGSIEKRAPPTLKCPSIVSAAITLVKQ